MRKILFTIGLLGFCIGAIINIPDDYPTIQEGIDAGFDGDTVLVADGTYYENLFITKSITLASHFIMNGDSTHRDLTIIDGSTAPENEIFRSTVVFYDDDPDSREIISPKMNGFTIRPGAGSRLILPEDFTGLEEPDTVFAGGGLLTVNASFDAADIAFIGTGLGVGRGVARKRGGVGATFIGTGIGVGRSVSRLENDTRDEYFGKSRNSRFIASEGSQTAGIKGSTWFIGTGIGVGREFFEIDMEGSVFTVYSTEYQDVSSYWCDTDNDANNFDVNNSAGYLEAITEDVWVSPSGTDESSIAGTELDPFKTIDYAVSRIYQADDNPITINLTEGRFSPETTGEIFPIDMFSNINLFGQGEEETIIDADGLSRVFIIDSRSNIIISGLTVMGGYTYGPYQNSISKYGGGFWITSSSSIAFTKMTIRNNQANFGGGIAIKESGITFTDVSIRDNIGMSIGGGAFFQGSEIIAKKLFVTGNEVFNNTWNAYCEGCGGGIFFSYSGSDQYFSQTTISGNIAHGDGTNEGEQGDGIYLYSSSPQISNSIVWGNGNAGEAPIQPGYGVNFTYSNVEGGWDGDGNIGEDPIDHDPRLSEDYTLQEGSPCIDGGEYDVWNLESDGTTADMGATGGSSILPNFTEYDFGEIGDIMSTTNFKLVNFGDSDISINSVSFSTTHFTTTTTFPIEIPVGRMGFIEINCLPESLGLLEDQMIINSSDTFIDGLLVLLTANGSDGNLLSGELSGTLEAAEYRITNDISVEIGQTLIISEGTKFLFDGDEFDFIVEGVLKAQGTESDSIIFDNFSDSYKWRGFTLNAVTNETIFEYVRISGADKGTAGDDSWGGGMALYGSDPILRHVVLSGNYGSRAGGIYVRYSNPILDHVIVTDNIAGIAFGAMDISNSQPIILNSVIANNRTGEYVDGVFVERLNCAAAIRWGSGGCIVTNTIIWNNGSDQLYSANRNVDYIITNSMVEITEGQLEYDYGEWGYWYGFSNNADIYNPSYNNIFEDPQLLDNFHLTDTSPCIDAGTADIDGDGIDDISDYYGEAPDIGAFEWTTDSQSGDLVEDGVINIQDIILMIEFIIGLSEPTGQQLSLADMNYDGLVNVFDVVLLMEIILFQ